MRSQGRKRAAKFKVGQVVVARAKLTNSSGSIVRAYRGDLLRVLDVTAAGFVVVQRGNDAATFGTTPDELRPLNKRERGCTPKRRTQRKRRRG